MTHARGVLRLIRWFRGGEEGQILVMAAVIMTVMLGLVGLAIDVGFLSHERRDLQNGADAMALAGGSQLKTTGDKGHIAAEAIAKQWGTKNGVATSEILGITFNITCNNVSAPNTITVRLTRTRPTFVARVLGINDATVGTCATAGRFSPGGSVGTAPFGVEDDCVFGPDGKPGTGDTGEMQPGSMVTIKYDSNNEDGAACDSNNGNFWTLAIDDTGTGTGCGTEPGSTEERKLLRAICYGAITPLCTPAAIALGEDCEAKTSTEPGNKVSATRDGVAFLVDNAPAACDTMAEIVEQIVVNGVTKYAIRNACNPFLPGYEGVSLVKLIPVLNGLFPDANGRSNVDIVDFMVVVIDPAQASDSNWCKGSNCDLQAKIVEVATNPQALRRALDDTKANNFTSLIH